MDVLQNSLVQLGALGILLFGGGWAIKTLWRQLAIERKNRDDDQRQSREELLKVIESANSSQAELQLLLKEIMNANKYEEILREFAKKSH